MVPCISYFVFCIPYSTRPVARFQPGRNTKIPESKKGPIFQTDISDVQNSCNFGPKITT